jgi:short-subunit dehydrogenase
MPVDLRDKSIIITGASSGIGAATAVAAARAGMHVVLNARRLERLTQIAELVEQQGRQAAIVVGDVNESDLSDRLLDEAQRQFGGFHAVFANAGFGLELPVIRMSESSLRELFETNFFASVQLCRLAALRLIERRQPGHLLMCSSCVAKFTLPQFAAYTASKAAQAHFCRAMRFELRPFGIEVASVHPITTSTEFFEQASLRSGRDVTTTVHDHAPKWLVQSPARVAEAVIRCLRRPRSEVWTSRLVLFSSGLFTMCPWILDLVLAREAARLRKAGEGP